MNSKSSCYLQYEISIDNTKYRVWPVNELRTHENTVTIEKGSRCSCQYRLDYDGQCCHELCIDHTFILDHYNARWFTSRVYDVKFPQNCVAPAPLAIIEGLSEETRNQLAIINTTAKNTTTHVVQTIGTGNDLNDRSGITNHSVTYNEMMVTCKELLRTVMNNQEQMCAVNSSLTEWTDKLMAHKHVAVTFHHSKNHTTMDGVADSIAKMPRPSITTQGHYSNRNKRFKSSREYFATGISQNNRQGIALACEDLSFISPSKPVNKKED